MAEAAPAAAAAKVKPQVFGVNPVAGIKTQFKVRFCPEVIIPLGSLIQVTFPDGFKVASDTVTSTRNIEVPVVAVAEGQIVTVAAPQEEKGKKKSKDSGAPAGTPRTPAPKFMSAAGATVSFVLNNVTNPGWSGVTGDMLIQVVNPSVSVDQDAAAVERLKQIKDAIAAGSSKKLSELPRRFMATYKLPGNEIQPGALEECSVVPTKLAVSKETDATLKFRTSNEVPHDGYIVARFHEDFKQLKSSEAIVVSGVQGPLQVTIISPLELRIERPIPDEPDTKEADAEAEAQAAAEAAAKAKAAAKGKGKGKGKAAKGNAAAKGKAGGKGAADDKDGDEEEEDAGPPALVEAGATAAIRVDGVTNPEDPGVRQKGARGERSYQLVTYTRSGRVIDEELAVPASKFTSSVDLDMLLNFVFPPKQRYPKSSGLLSVFALYGPLDNKGQLRGGKFGSRVVTENELVAMVKEIEREDLINIFTDNANLSRAQEEQVLQETNSVKAKMLTNFTKEQVVDLFAAIKRDEEGGLSFHTLQKLLLELRQARVDSFKEMFPGLTGKHKHKGLQKKKFKMSGVRKKVLSVTEQKYSPTESFFVMNRILHQRSHLIANENDRNTGLNENVWIMRVEEPHKNIGPAWDANCCLGNAARDKKKIRK